MMTIQKSKEEFSIPNIVELNSVENHVFSTPEAKKQVQLFVGNKAYANVDDLFLYLHDKLGHDKRLRDNYLYSFQ